GALSYLHGRGLVHCDLKPANVIIRASGQPVLVDFGLASRFAGRKNREALSGRREVEGTSAYMSPEQIRAAPVDARTDLYALGCVLYEILSGRPPFIGPTAMSVMLKHLGQDPKPLSILIPWISKPLEALVMGLLHKEPRDRIGFADIVARQLYEVVADRLNEADVRIAAEPKAYLYRSELVGRDAAVAEVRVLIDQLPRRQGQVALIAGNSGLGKTRMAQEVVRLSTERAFQVLTGRALPISDRLAEGQSAFRAPLETFSAVFRTIADRCLAFGRSEIDRLMGPRLRILAAYDATLRALPELSSYPRPGTLAGESAHHRLYGALADTLLAMTTKGPVVLVLDDIHWADELTLGFLVQLALSGRLEGSKLLVLATYRPEEVKPQMAPLISAPNVSSITLSRLSNTHVVAMIRDMLALQEVPEAFGKTVFDRSEGNPFFVAEYLRTAVAVGALTRDAHGHWNVSKDDVRELPLPKTLRALSVRRLDGLSPGARYLAKVAAVIGRESREVWLSHAVQMAPRAFMDALSELASRQIMEHRDPGTDVERWRFSQDDLRGVLLSHIHFNQLAALHRAVAQMFEAQQDPRLTTQLARHWEEAGESARARYYYRVSALQASEVFAHEEAVRLYRAYLALVDTPTAESIEARQTLAKDVLAMMGQLREALGEQAIAVEEAQMIGDPALEGRALITLAQLTRRLGDFEQAREWCRQALTVVRNRGDVRGEVMALKVLGMVYWNQNHYEAAEALYARCLELLGTITAPELLEETLGRKALLLWSKGERDEARKMFSRQLVLVRQGDDRVKEGRVLGNLASIDRELGDVLQAQARFEETLGRKALRVWSKGERDEARTRFS
ncbi:MAG: AAA family ATPase, partial [Myxococcota bacterium]